MFDFGFLDAGGKWAVLFLGFVGFRCCWCWQLGYLDARKNKTGKRKVE